MSGFERAAEGCGPVSSGAAGCGTSPWGRCLRFGLVCRREQHFDLLVWWEQEGEP